MITTSRSPSSSTAPSVMRRPPPNDGPFPTATSIASSGDLPVVELQGVRQRLEDPQLGERGDVVAHLPLRPGHPVGPLVDDASKPAASTVTKYCRAAPGEVDGAGDTGDHPVDGGVGVLARDVEVARDVVAGAGRDDAERGARRRPAPGPRGGPCRRHRTRPGRRPRRRRTAGPGPAPRPRRGPARSRTVEAGAPQTRERPLPGPGALALARRGVGQEGDLRARHARRLPVCSSVPDSSTDPTRRRTPYEPGPAPTALARRPIASRAVSASIREPGTARSIRGPSRRDQHLAVPPHLVGADPHRSPPRPAPDRRRRPPAGRTPAAPGPAPSARRRRDDRCRVRARPPRSPRTPPASRAGRRGPTRRTTAARVVGSQGDHTRFRGARLHRRPIDRCDVSRDRGRGRGSGR